MYKDIVNHLTPVFCYFFHTFPWHVSQLEETENFHAAFSVAFRPLSPNTDQWPSLTYGFALRNANQEEFSSPNALLYSSFSITYSPHIM